MHRGETEQGNLRREWYERGFYVRQTLPEALAEASEKHAERRLTFYSDGDFQSYSVTEVHERASALAAGLQELGLQPRDVIALQVPNRIEGAHCLLAAMLAGLVVLPIVHIYAAREVSYLLRESGAKALIVPDHWRNIDYLDRLKALSDTPRLEHRIVIGDEVPTNCIALHELDTRRQVEWRELDADDLALILFTSGTTSNPKGALHSHNSLLSELRLSFTSVVEDAVALSPWPAGHIAGVLAILRPFVNGTESVLMDAWDARAGAMLVERFKVTHSSGTPFHINSLLDAAETDHRDVSSLRDYMVGAAAVPPEVVERCERAGIATYRAYGSTEHPTITSGTAELDARVRSRTDGRLNPGCRIKIADDNGNELAIDEEGEVLSQGPDQFLGYHRPELNEDAFSPDGWFKTGDLGRLDEDGFLTITDRKKDIIIRGGENISSKEVEDYLCEHPAVGEAAVVAAPDERLGERVCAFVIPRTGEHVDMEAVHAHFLALKVAKQKIPERLEVVSSLPRTASGKVQKFLLRERLRNSGSDAS